MGDDRGSALIPAVLLLAVMLTMGLALLSVVDTQSTASADQREADAAFNLADSVLGATAFVLSSDWPEAPAAGQPWSGQATCGARPLTGGVSAGADASTTAGRIERVAAKAAAARGTPASSAARWRVHVCDAGAEGAWSPALLTRASYDATGLRTITRTDGTHGQVRQLWVSATATVDGRSRTVAGLVQADELPALPTGYGILAGRLAFLNGVNAVTDSVLGDRTALGRLTGALLGTTPMVTGRIGVRCGLLRDLCADAVASTLTTIPLLDAAGVTNAQVVQHGAATATDPGVVDRLRRRAVAAGTYRAHVDHHAPCLPTGHVPGPGSVVFIEEVGSGNHVCRIPAGPSRDIGTVVVGRGRIEVLSPPGGGPATLTGVLHALNGQDERAGAVIRLNRDARVRGAVYADGGGIVSLAPPAFSLTDAVCAAAAMKLLCLITPVTGLLDVALSVLGLDQVVTMLLPQLSAYGPVVAHDPAVVGRVTVLGPSGIVQGSFQQVTG